MSGYPGQTLALVFYLLHERKMYVGQYAVYIAWLHTHFLTHGEHVWRYLNTLYPQWRYPFTFCWESGYGIMSEKLLAAYKDPTQPGSLGGVAEFAKAHGLSKAKVKQLLQQELRRKADENIFLLYLYWCLTLISNGSWTWSTLKN